MAGENELIPYPMDIGPLLDSLPRKKRDYRSEPLLSPAAAAAWQAREDKAIWDVLSGRWPPPKNEGK